jgi:gliding motility-associated-like protein
MLRSSAGDTYLWSTGAATQEIQVTASGTYTVQVFNDQGHPSSPSDPVTVTIHPLPDLSVQSLVDAACNGESSGSADLSGTGGTAPYTYGWNSGHSGAQVSGLPAGNYTVILSDAEMCSDTVSFSINEPTAILVTDSISHPFCADAEDGSISVTVSGGTPGYTLLWSDGSNGNSLEDLSPGIVSLTVTDANDCEVTKDYDLLPAFDHCIFIPDIITPNNDNFNDTWMIRGLEYYSDVQVDIYDRWGKPVYQSRGYDIPWDGTMNGDELPMDSYHYIIRIGSTSSTLVGNITIIR